MIESAQDVFQASRLPEHIVSAPELSIWNLNFAYSLCFQFSGPGFTCESLHDARVPRFPRFTDPEKRFSLFPPVGHTKELEI